MSVPSARVPLLLVLVWVGGLLAATSVGLLSVRLVAAQVGDPAVAPLSAVAAASGAPSGTSSGAAPATAAASATPTGVPPSSAAPRPSPSPGRPVGTAPAVAATQTFATAAGTLGVQCTGTTLRLLLATPAPGYALDERSVGGTEAEVRFQGAGARVRVRLSCATGVPRLVEQRTDPDGGRGDDDRPDDDRPDDDGKQDDDGRRDDGGRDDGEADDD